MKVIVVGSLNTDITTYTDRFPVAGETVTGKDVRIGPGGKGSNQATAAARSGAEVIMVGKIGKDDLAATMKSHFLAEKMCLDYIVEDDGATGCALIEVDSTGENRIVVIPGANGRLSAADVDAAEQEFTHGGVVLIQNETSLESRLEAKRLAMKYGLTMIYNPAPMQKMPNGFFEGVDIVTPNETEAEFFTGIAVRGCEDGIRAAEKFIELGAKSVIITMGSKGALYYDGTPIFVPAMKVKAVDTTGAGDAFNGALAAALAEGKTITEALKFAGAVGALSVTKVGAATAMPSREETEEFLIK